MGKKLNALFGKSKPFKKSKFKTIVTLAVSRIAILKKHHHIRWSQARSDVVQLLTLNHQESALLRVDHVIREQNILDAFGIIDGYCRLLIDRIMLIENSKACPDELKEAISSLIFAASRYGQLPELQKIYRIFMAKYGKNFSNHAIELRNNCGVNPKIAKKFPSRWPSCGTKLKVLNEIASENGIILRVEGESSGISKGKLDTRESNGLNDHKLKNATKNSPEGIQEDENFSRFMKERSKYRDAKTAAEAAFELAAQAAAAARAVVELSQSKLNEKDSADHISSGFQQLKLSYPVGSSESELQNGKVTASDFKDWTKGLHSDKIDCFDTNSKPIEDGMVGHKFSSYSKEAGSKYVKEQTKNVLAASSTDSEEIGIYNPLKTGGGSYGNMDEKGKRQGKLPWLELNDENKKGSLVHKAPATAHDWNAHKKFSFLRDEFLKNRHPNAAKDENNSDENRDELDYHSPMDGQYSNRGRRPVSIRTRRTRWH